MSTQIILKVLALRHRLRQRDRWRRRELEEYQGWALHRMRGYAYARSPFYTRFHKGFADRPLADLPILTKEMVMEHFDELVADPTVRLAEVEAHLAILSGSDELLGGRYRVASTSGSTGKRASCFGTPTSGLAGFRANVRRAAPVAGAGSSVVISGPPRGSRRPDTGGDAC
jgi:phenylacetate-CoA ligase